MERFEIDTCTGPGPGSDPDLAQPGVGSEAQNEQGVVAVSASSEQRAKVKGLQHYWRCFCRWELAGIGMFSEAYIIFSLGVIKPFQRVEWPTCFETFEECPDTVVNTQNYIQICGMIVGMLFFGGLADVLGRKWASRIVGTIMMTGAVVLTATPFISAPLAYLVTFMVMQTWYSFGVGGESPTASASAAERAQEHPELRASRGREVVLTFSGQGQGNFTNSLVILICMAIYGQTGDLTSPGSRNVIATQYGVGAALCVIMVIYRFRFLHESKVWQAEREDTSQLVHEESLKSAAALAPPTTLPLPGDPLPATAAAKDSAASQVATALTSGGPVLALRSLKRFWPRLVATSMGWVASDFAFYGNKLFQSTFITILYPSANQLVRQQYTLLNSAVALCGYYVAALLIDRKWYGRRRMQIVGFMMIFLLFGACAIFYGRLIGSRGGLAVFQVLYYLSSFFTQMGPNCTTWLVAGEAFPTDVRGTYHGFNAAMGKVGALLAGVIFGYVGNATIFKLSGIAGLLGAIVTWIFLPDSTGLDLDELDCMFKYDLAGQFNSYRGEAINPKHLSVYERWVLKWHKRYEPNSVEAAPCAGL